MLSAHGPRECALLPKRHNHWETISLCWSTRDVIPVRTVTLGTTLPSKTCTVRTVSFVLCVPHVGGGKWRSARIYLGHVCRPRGLSKFLFDQEPIFLWKAQPLINAPQSRIWVLDYSERIIRVCMAMWRLDYSEFRLWFLPPSMIGLAWELGKSMSVPLGSLTNFRE